MTTPKSYKGILKHFHAKDKVIQQFMEHLPSLLESNYPFDVALSYLFSRLELGQNIIIYASIRKKYKTDTRVTEVAIENWDSTKDTFESRFEIVFGKPVPTAIMAAKKAAQRVRNKVMHGKSVSEPEKRAAIAEGLDYAQSLNTLVMSELRFEPFGKITGITGAAPAMDASATRFLLKGMGFNI